MSCPFYRKRDEPISFKLVSFVLYTHEKVIGYFEPSYTLGNKMAAAQRSAEFVLRYEYIRFG